MGLLSSSKSSSSDDDITINNVDYGESSAEAPINLVVRGDGNKNTTNVTKTDFGSIAGALDLAANAVDNIQSIAGQAANDNAQLAQQAAKNGSEKVLSSATNLIGVILLGAGVIAFFLRKK